MLEMLGFACSTQPTARGDLTTPEDLISQGWEDVTHPTARERTENRELVNPETGTRVRFDKGRPGANGWEGRDHYHVHNPEATSRHDEYLDINGNPVRRNSKPSHIAAEDFKPGNF